MAKLVAKKVAQKGFSSGFCLDSCRAGINLNQTLISVPGTVMHYNCVYMHSMS